MLRHFPHLQPLLLLQKEAVPQGEAEAEDSHKNCLLQSSLYYLNKEAGGRIIKCLLSLNNTGFVPFRTTTNIT